MLREVTERYESDDAARVQRNAWVTAASALPWAAIPIAWLVHAFGGPPLAVLTPHLLAIGTLSFLWTWKARPLARREPTKVAADASGVTLGTERIPRAEIADALLLPVVGGFPIVRVSRKGKLQPAIDVVVRDEGEARKLISALGFDATQRTATFRVGSFFLGKYRWSMFAIVPIMFGMGLAAGAIGHAVIPLMYAAIFAVAFAALWPSWLVVGADGLLLRWLWLRKFVPAQKIVTATRYDKSFGRSRVRGVALSLESGEQLEVPVTTSRWDDERLAIILERIHEVMELQRSGAAVAEDALLLARGSQSTAEWVRRLRALGEGATAQLRVAPMQPERLWRVALDPAAASPARAAAAVALSGSLDDEGRARLRVAAEATAAPKLRVVLDRAVEGNEEELIAALDELHSDSG